ncbi:fatty acid desaturase family protein [Crocosphaera sp.]|uniref:fatty acid desaturase family protein n=1 Tax=Crocosphaera sp. TaxID=2729996 RepID=UPI003F1ECA34
MHNVAKGNNVTSDLRKAILSQTNVNPWLGLLRFFLLGTLVFSLVSLAWMTHDPWIFAVESFLAGFIYFLWLICTHDATHYTLTQWKWFEEIAPRLQSYPMLWPYGIYQELHQLHHGWNGLDFRDPERSQWTQQEYETASIWQQWYVKHQWPIDIFILGAMGLIIKTIVQGVQLRSVRPRLQGKLTMDLVCILLIQGVFLAIAFSVGMMGRYFLLLLILERTIGFFMQIRDHLEHYQMWRKSDNYLLTQLYATRNILVPNWVQWLMGGLPYHGVHHGFPNIPFHRLPEAFDNIQSVLKEHDYPEMTRDKGYFRTAWRLSHQPSLISDTGQVNEG